MSAALLPPYDVEAEQAVLAACLIDPERVDELADRLEASDFFGSAHQRIFAVMLSLRAEGAPIDTVTVGAKLRGQNRLAEIGGLSYLTETLNAVPYIPRIQDYVKVVKNKSRLRDVLAFCRETEHQILSGVEDAPAFIDSAEARMLRLNLAGRRDKDARPIGEIISSSFIRIRDAVPGSIRGVSTGFPCLDARLSGLVEGELTVLAARPGCGKTSLAWSLAVSVAKEGHGIAFFSAEMQDEALGIRGLCATADVDSRGYQRDTGFTKTEFGRIVSAAQSLAGYRHFYVCDGPMQPAGVTARARRLSLECQRDRRKLGLVIIDYLQLLQLGVRKGESHEQALATATQDMKVLATTIRAPVLLISSLNRGSGEQRKNARPTLADLRGSGQIEFHADNVLFLHREHLAAPKEREMVEIIVGKQRNGALGVELLAFHPASTHFEECTHEEADGYAASLS